MRCEKLVRLNLKEDRAEMQRNHWYRFFFSKLAPIRSNHDRLDTGKRERVRLVYYVYRSLVFSFGFSLVN